MRSPLRIPLALLVFGCVVSGCKREPTPLDPALVRFVKARQTQARELVESNHLHMPSRGWKLFDAILADDFSTATNLFARVALERSLSTNVPNAATIAIDQVKTFLANRGWYSPPSRALDGAAWQTLSEAHWAYVQTKQWHAPFLQEIVSNIVSIIPNNAVYFGGTDVGRFSVTAAMETSKDKRGILILTQNQLMDYGYCQYADAACNQALILPNASDCNAGWGRLFGKASSNITQAAVMRESGELVRLIIEKNPDREFFIEQSLMIEWLYPHLSPHGPILKINRQPLSRLSEETVNRDRAYWAAFCREYIGDWIKAGETTVSAVCEFSERTYLHKELEGFSGDRRYTTDQRAQEYFSKLRLTTALLYHWQCIEATEMDEKTRMWKECLLAFEQAFALGPVNSEVASYFADILVGVKRYKDALHVLRICQALNPTNKFLTSEIIRIQELAESAN